MKIRFAFLFLFLCLSALAQSGPQSGTVSFLAGTVLPSHCSPLPALTFYLNSGGTTTPYYCSATDTWSPSLSSSSVVVTDSPFFAKCDGGSDDSVPLQAAFNSGHAIVELPSWNLTTGFQQCNFASNLTLPNGVTLQGNFQYLDFTGNGVGIQTSDGSNQIINLNYEVDATTGSVTAIRTGHYGLITLVNLDEYVGFSPAPTYYSLYLDDPLGGGVEGSVVDGPVFVSATPHPYFSFQFRDFYIGVNNLAYHNLLTIDGLATNLGFYNVGLNMESSIGDGTACAICITNTVNAHPRSVNFTNVNIDSSVGYTGYFLSTSFSGPEVAPVVNGNIDTSLALGGNLYTGTWTGTLAFGSTTYRGSAALLTYRCNGGTQAGLIYTNNTSCSGGTAVLTGDSTK